MPALLTRDVTILPRVLKVLQLPKPTASMPNKPDLEILYPRDFVPEDCPEQVDAMEAFLKDISEATNCKYRQISIHEDWQKTAPVEEKDLRQYLYYVSL